MHVSLPVLARRAAVCVRQYGVVHLCGQRYHIKRLQLCYSTQKRLHCHPLNHYTLAHARQGHSCDLQDQVRAYTVERCAIVS